MGISTQEWLYSIVFFVLVGERVHIFYQISKQFFSSLLYPYDIRYHSCVKTFSEAFFVLKKRGWLAWMGFKGEAKWGKSTNYVEGDLISYSGNIMSGLFQ